MRMRKKKNLIPRMERRSRLLIREPEAMRGSWLSGGGFSGLHLELGCGKGRFTAEMAGAMPDTLLVAVERVPDAMVVAMERTAEAGLQNVLFIDADAGRVTEIFSPGEVGRIYINFCDPWPRDRQAKRRLTAPGFLALYRRILAPGGEIWFKTDNSPLFEYSVEQFGQHGFELYELTRDLHGNGPVGVMTDYEAKFHAEGVPINRCVARMGEAAE